MKKNARNTSDALEFIRRMGTKTPVSVVFFDPQYRSVLDKMNYGNEGERQKRRAQLDQMSDSYITSVVTEAAKIMKPSGHMFLWVDKFLAVGPWQKFIVPETELQLVDMITWHKGKIGMGYRTRRSCEYLMVLQKLPIRAKGVWTDHGIPDTWTERVNTKEHPHAKPIGLQMRLIEATTCVKDNVLDPAAGSYSVLQACKESGRTFYGCDLQCPQSI